MHPGQVDQLIHALGLAREESDRRVSVGGRKVRSDSNGIVREVEEGSVTQAKEVVGGEDT